MWGRVLKRAGPGGLFPEKKRTCILPGVWDDEGAGGAPVSTSDWRRWQHAGDDSLAPLTIGSKQTNANSNELALAA